MEAIALESPPRWKRGLPYVALSLLSGLLELGVVLAGARAGWPLLWLLLIALSYQLGVLASAMMTIRATWVRNICLTAAVIAIIANHNPVLTGSAVFLLSLAIHRLRGMSKANSGIGTTGKRAARVLGFILAAGFSNSGLVGLSVITGILVFAVPRNSEGRNVIPSQFRTIDAAMVTHQAHYFSYAYAVPVVLLSLAGFNTLATAAAFSAGWISYTAAPALLGALPARRVVVAGHVAVALLLLLMSQAATGHGGIAFVFLWFLSGFGGGTVFAIRRLAERDPAVPAVDVWEDIGHVAGVSVAVGVMMVAASPAALFTTSAILALVTALVVAAFVEDTPLRASEHWQGSQHPVTAKYGTVGSERRSA